MNQQRIRKPDSSGHGIKHSRLKYFAGNCALAAGLIGCGVLFAWSLVNPRHLTSASIYGIILADYLVGFALVVLLLVRTSANQPLDAKTNSAPEVWESDFQSWNTSLGIRLLATEKQLDVLRRLFVLGNCIDNSVIPPRLDETKRHALLKLIQQPQIDGNTHYSNQEYQVLFSGLQYGDRHHVSAILRDLRRLGNPALVTRICSAPLQARCDMGSRQDIHFEEIRATAPQCMNVLSALAILHSDQDTLLRASSESAALEPAVLLRPAKEAETRTEELLRSVDNQN